MSGMTYNPTAMIEEWVAAEQGIEDEKTLYTCLVSVVYYECAPSQSKLSMRRSSHDIIAGETIPSPSVRLADAWVEP
jgi:hypothetical protein